VGLGGACEERGRAAPRALAEGGLEPVFDAPLANPMDGSNADIDRVRNVLIGEPLIRFEQHAGSREAASRHSTAAQQLLEFRAFRLGEIDRVLDVRPCALCSGHVTLARRCHVRCMCDASAYQILSD